LPLSYERLHSRVPTGEYLTTTQSRLPETVSRARKRLPAPSLAAARGMTPAPGVPRYVQARTTLPSETLILATAA